MNARFGLFYSNENKIVRNLFLFFAMKAYCFIIKARTECSITCTPGHYIQFSNKNMPKCVKNFQHMMLYFHSTSGSKMDRNTCNSVQQILMQKYCANVYRTFYIIGKFLFMLIHTVK